MISKGVSYLRPSKVPPRGGAAIRTLDDLQEDLTVVLELALLRECKKKRLDELLQIGVTSTGYKLMLYRPVANREHSRGKLIEHHSTTSYPTSWREPFLQSVEVFREIDQFLIQRYPDGPEHHIVPELCDLYRGFIPLSRVRVVIIGQDPYTNLFDDRPVAIGRAFALRRGVVLKSIRAGQSLVNIIEEAKREFPDFEYDDRDCELESWAEQGVMLINASLTGEQGMNEKANSHQGRWKSFIRNCLLHIMNTLPFCIFVAWGGNAQDIIKRVEPSPTKFPVIKSAHPSSLAVMANNPFAGSKPFTKINEYLVSFGSPPINWSLVRPPVEVN